MHKLNVAVRSLNYQRDIAHFASRLADLPGFVVLASNVNDRQKTPRSGRYDVITALPEQTLSIADFEGDVAAWMSAIEARLALGNFAQPSEATGDTPFLAGAIGYLDYDSAAVQHGVKHPAVGHRLAQVAGWAGLYRWCIVQDHQQRQSWCFIDPAVSVSTNAMIEQRLFDNQWQPKPLAFKLTAPFTADITRARYQRDVLAIQAYIQAGDCYQVNYAQRFSAQYSGDTWAAFEQLRATSGGDFSAYLRPSPEHSILSFSPERFLTVNAGSVETQPIKGTRPRSVDPERDRQLAMTLQNSAKDRAENVMITDLLRNDLGRFCEIGSVEVPELCALHSYPNVHHLVSTVVGKLRSNVSSGLLLAASSPGGSITGAPKRRAIEIIAELESSPRGAYCGSVFALSANGWLQSSIAIRTLEAINEQLVCWGGGGITADSDWQAEYQETLDKIGVFMAALEQQFGL